MSYVIKKTLIRQFHEIWTIFIDKKSDSAFKRG